jgi:hypothetical protein
MKFKTRSWVVMRSMVNEFLGVAGAVSNTAFLAVVASAKNAFRTEYHHIS